MDFVLVVDRVAEGRVNKRKKAVLTPTERKQTRELWGNHGKRVRGRFRRSSRAESYLLDIALDCGVNFGPVRVEHAYGDGAGGQSMSATSSDAFAALRGSE